MESSEALRASLRGAKRVIRPKSQGGSEESVLGALGRLASFHDIIMSEVQSPKSDEQAGGCIMKKHFILILKAGGVADLPDRR